MTQEDKQLLLVDLCGRLPYGVIGAVEHYDEVDNNPVDLLGTLQGFDNNSKGIKFVYLPDYTDDVGAYNWFNYIRFKPYLRPMSSITEEEKIELSTSLIYANMIDNTRAQIDWLNAHHFDYRGLIPKGLAISTKEFNPYKD